MASGERERRELPEALVGTSGPDPADTLLGYLPPVGWADVATKRDLDHFATQLRLEMKTDLRGEFAAVRSDLEHALRTQLIGTVTLLIAIVATGILTR